MTKLLTVFALGYLMGKYGYDYLKAKVLSAYNYLKTL